MAEAVGLVSGGAGLVSLSMQLLGSAQKLKGFCRDVKNAPKLLTTLGYDLETLGLMLQEFERYRLANPSPTGIILERCIVRFQEEVETIGSQIAKLGERLRRSRVRGRLVTAFEEPEIKKTLDDLERAKSTLWLAHQIYMDCHRSHEEQEHRQAVLTCLDRLLPSTTSETNTSAQSLVSRRTFPVDTRFAFEDQGEDDARASIDHSPPMKYRALTTRIKRRSSETRARNYSIKMPLWLRGKVWSIAMSHTNWGLTFTLRAFTCHERFDLLYYESACVRGDLKNMIASGQIGPRDRQADLGPARSVISFAVRYGHIEILEFLLHQCGLATDTDIVAQTLGQLVSRSASWSIPDDHFRNLYHFLLENIVLEVDIDASKLEVADIPRWLLSCPDVDTLRQLLDEHLFLDTQRIVFPPERICEISAEQIFQVHNPEVLLYLFGMRWSLLDLGLLTLNAKQLLLHVAAAKWAITVGQAGEQRHTIPNEHQWLLLAQNLVGIGAHPIDPNGLSSTIMMILQLFLSAFMMYPALWTENAQKALKCIQIWALTMQKAGIDLFSYSRDEAKAWEEHRCPCPELKRPRTDISDCCLFCNPYIQVCNLSYGSLPTDWTFDVRRYEGVTVWQRSSMPGAWVNETYAPTTDIRGLWCDDLQFQGWQKVKSIVVASNVTNVSSLEHDSIPCPFHGADERGSEACPSRHFCGFNEWEVPTMTGDLIGTYERLDVIAEALVPEETDQTIAADAFSSQFGTYWEAPL